MPAVKAQLNHHMVDNYRARGGKYIILFFSYITLRLIHCCGSWNSTLVYLQRVYTVRRRRRRSETKETNYVKGNDLSAVTHSELVRFLVVQP